MLLKRFQLIIGMIVAAAGFSASAQNTWYGAGADNLWSTSANWSSGTPANDGTAYLAFDGTTRLTPDMDADWSVGSINIGSSAGNFTLGSTGGHTLTLSSFNHQASASTVTINTPLILSSAQAQHTFYVNSGASLIVNGGVNTNGTTLFLDGNSTKRFNGVISGSGGVSTGYFTESEVTNTNTYTGPTNLQRGTFLVSGANGALANTSALVIRNPLGSGTDGITLGSSADTAANPNRLNDAAPISLDGAQVNLFGTDNVLPTSETVGQITLAGGLSRLAVIPANGTRQAELVSTAALIRSPGAMLSVAHFNGATDLGGTGAGSTRILLPGGAPALVGGGGLAGSTTVSIAPFVVGSSPGTIGDDTLVTYGATGLRPLNVATEYATNLSGAPSAANVRLTSAQALPATATVNALVLAGGSAAANLGANNLSVTSGAVLFSDSGTISGGGLNFGAREGLATVNGFNGTALATIATNLQGTNGLTLNSNSPIATFRLTGASSYTGVTRVNAETTVTNGSAFGPSGAGNEVVIGRGGLLRLEGAVTLAKDITATTGGTSYGGNQPIITARSGSSVIDGNVTLAVADSGENTPQIQTISGARLTINGNIASGAAGVSQSLYFDARSGTDIVVNGAIQNGASSLNSISMNGTVRFNAANTYSGATYLSGAFFANNPAGSATGTGTVYGFPGATLGGIGAVVPASGGNQIFMYPGATIAPGDPLLGGGVGTLTIGDLANAASLSFYSDSHLDFQLGTLSDELVLHGGITLLGPNITVDLGEAAGLASGTYTLVDYSGALTGSFADLTLGNVPVGYAATLVNNLANTSIDVNLTLTAVPEPATLAMPLAAILGLSWLRRRQHASAGRTARPALTV